MWFFGSDPRAPGNNEPPSDPEAVEFWQKVTEASKKLEESEANEARGSADFSGSSIGNMIDVVVD